jgi:hypothetical protein
MGRNSHVTSLTGIRTDLNDNNASALGKNTLITRTEVGIDIPSKFLSLAPLVLRFSFEARDLRLDASRLFDHFPLEFFDLSLRLCQACLLLLNLFEQTEPFFFDFFVRFFHQLNLTTHSHELSFVTNAILPHTLFFDLAFFFFELQLSRTMAGFKLGEAKLVGFSFLLFRFDDTSDGGNLLPKLLESGFFLA